MRKNILKTLIVSLCCFLILNSQTIDSEKIDGRLIKKIQKKIIDQGDAGGNVVMLYKNGKIIFHHIQNSYKKGDKLISNQTLFPIWSMSKPNNYCSTNFKRKKLIKI
jgi:CubicO group peptidase (beta-lactamase class C family)